MSICRVLLGTTDMGKRIKKSNNNGIECAVTVSINGALLFRIAESRREAFAAIGTHLPPRT